MKTGSTVTNYSWQNRKGSDAEQNEQPQDEQTQEDQIPTESSLDLLEGVKHFKQSTVRIESDMILYFDPYKFSGTPHDADIIFITINGDTNFVPELQNIRADVAFLNVGGGSSMTAEEAAEAAAVIEPKVAVPIHYGFTHGTVANARTFLDILDDSIQGQMYSDDGEMI